MVVDVPAARCLSRVNCVITQVLRDPRARAERSGHRWKWAGQAGSPNGGRHVSVRPSRLDGPRPSSRSRAPRDDDAASVRCHGRVVGAADGGAALVAGPRNRPGDGTHDQPAGQRGDRQPAATHGVASAHGRACGDGRRRRTRSWWRGRGSRRGRRRRGVGRRAATGDGGVTALLFVDLGPCRPGDVSRQGGRHGQVGRRARRGEQEWCSAGRGPRCWKQCDLGSPLDRSGIVRLCRGRQRRPVGRCAVQGCRRLPGVDRLMGVGRLRITGRGEGSRRWPAR